MEPYASVAASGNLAVWTFTQVAGQAGTVYYITNVGRTTCAALLDAQACTTNILDFVTAADTTGRQQWTLAPLGPANEYNILAGGRAACNQYLSTTTCAGGPTFDIYYEDDGSGRQRWLVVPYTAAGR